MIANRSGVSLGLVPLTAVGCGQDRPHSVGYSSFQGLLPGAVTGADFDAAVAPAEGVLAVTAYGSGSCPTVPVKVRVSSPHVIKVEMNGDYKGACTADLGPTTTLIKLDRSSLNFDSDLRVQYSGAGTGSTRPRTLTSVPTASTPLGRG